MHYFILPLLLLLLYFENNGDNGEDGYPWKKAWRSNIIL
jgi:hypothetical protein